LQRISLKNRSFFLKYTDVSHFIHQNVVKKGDFTKHIGIFKITAPHPLI